MARQFNRIDIGLNDGVSLEQGVAAFRQALGDGFTIEPPSSPAQIDRVAIDLRKKCERLLGMRRRLDRRTEMECRDATIGLRQMNRG